MPTDTNKESASTLIDSSTGTSIMSNPELTKSEKHFRVFYEKKISSIIPKGQKLITLTPQDSIVTALDMLANNNIMSAPLLDNKGVLMGSLGMVSILRFLVANLPKTAPSITEMKTLAFQGKPFGEAKLSDVFAFKYPLGHPNLTIMETATVEEALEQLATPVNQTHKWWPHRLLMVDANAAFKGIVSQTDIIRALKQHMCECPVGQCQSTCCMSALQLPYKHTTIQQFMGTTKTGQEALITVPHTASVLHALEKMYTHNVSIVGLVGTSLTGSPLTGCFEARSLRGLLTGQMHHLLDDVQTFLLNNDPESLIGNIMTPDAKMADIVNNLIETKRHHVFICDHSAGDVNNITTEKKQALEAYLATENPEQIHLDRFLHKGVPAPMAIVSITDITSLLHTMGKSHVLMMGQQAVIPLSAATSESFVKTNQFKVSQTEQVSTFELVVSIGDTKKQDLDLTMVSNIIELHNKSLKQPGVTKMHLPEAANPDAKTFQAVFDKGKLHLTLQKVQKPTGIPIA